MLSEEEKGQYQRHLSLPLVGRVGQEKLKSSSVLVIGAGGLGCPVLQYLVSAGVGKIGIVDDDLVEISNLQRQVLYTHEDIGKPKVKIAVRRLKLLNPYVEIMPHFAKFNSENAEGILLEYDLVVDGTDNFSSRYLINDACVLFGKTLIYGAIYQFEGQVSVFNHKGGPTYRCLYPNPPNSNGLPSCGEIGVLGVLPGIIGSFQALEAIKILLDIGDSLSGKVLLYDALSQKTRLIRLKVNNKNKTDILLADNYNNSSCSSQKNSEFMINEIQPNEFSKMLNSGVDILIFDVRESWERDVSKISPSIHIPLGDFSTPFLKLPKDINEKQNIVLYCKAGVRSRIAAGVLSDMGYKNLYNLEGGITKWESEGFKIS